MDTYLKVGTNVTDFAASAGSTLQRIYEIARSEAAIKRYKILAEVSLRVLEIVYYVAIAIAVTVWETARNCLEESEMGMMEAAEATETVKAVEAVEAVADTTLTSIQQVRVASAARSITHPVGSVVKVEPDSVNQMPVAGKGA